MNLVAVQYRRSGKAAPVGYRVHRPECVVLKPDTRTIPFDPADPPRPVTACRRCKPTFAVRSLP